MKSKKLLSLVLAVLLCVGMLPMSVLTVSAAGHSHCVCGGNTAVGDHTTHSYIEFTEWTSTDSMPDTTGNYVLMNDVTLSSAWYPADGTVLCLNGNDIKVDANTDSRVIYIESHKSLVLCDCSEQPGKITGGHDQDWGGGIHIDINATLTMYNGLITGNSAGAGAGVYNSGIFNMYGGKIYGNTADSYGGGVYHDGNTAYRAMKLLGNATITDNFLNDGTDSNLHVGTRSGEIGKVTISDEFSGNVGISMYEYGVFSIGGKDNSQYFTADNPDYMVSTDGDNLKLVELKPVQVGQVELANGEYTTEGINKTAGEPTGEGYAYYNDGVLTLNEFNYNDEGKNGIIIHVSSDTKINLLGDNSLTVPSSATIGVTALQINSSAVALTGNGSLNITASGNHDYGVYLVGVNAKLNILDTNLSIESYCNSINAGSTASSLYIESSEISLTSSNDYAISVGDVRILNSELELNSGSEYSVFAPTSMTIENSTIVSDGGFAFNSGGALDFKSGSILVQGTYGAFYPTNASLNLPTSDYWWRTASDAEFTKNTAQAFVYGEQNYVEITTNDPDNKVQVGKVTLYDGEYTTDGIDKTAGEPAGTGYAYYKNGVLTLNNFTYSGGGSNGSVIYATTDLTIHAVGNNTIDSSEKYAVHLNGGNLTITGDVLNLTVSNSANADTAVLLFDFAGAYGSLTMSDVTLNVQYAEVSERKTYGISCGNVIIDNTALTVDMHVSEGAMMCTGDGLRSYGTVEIKNNSRVIIDLSEGVESTGLRVEDANISISDSYVELRGNGAYGIGLAFNTSYKTLDFNSGTLIIAGAHNTNGAAYMYNATLELPVGNYWWRTDENGSYSKGDYTYNKNQTYIEITTSKPQNEWVSTPTISGWVYGQEKGTPQAEAKYGTVEFEYYNEDKIVLGELPDNAGTYYLKGFVLETNNYTGLESDYVWFAVEKDEQIVPPRPTGVNTTYIDTNDGKITGVDETMEYRKEGETNYTAVTGTEITGLAPGKYYVRYAEKANYNPSPDKVVTISEGPKRTATIAITATLDKTYDGNAVTEPVKDNGFTYDGDGTASVKWYADNNGAKGDELTEAPKNAGEYWIGVAATEGTTYNAAPEVTKQFEITKATPTISKQPTVPRIKRGDALSSVPFNGGEVLGVNGAALSGTFEWKDGTTLMSNIGKYMQTVVFTPDDNSYKAVEFDIEAEVYINGSGGNGVTRYTVKFEANGGSQVL